MRCNQGPRPPFAKFVHVGVTIGGRGEGSEGTSIVEAAALAPAEGGQGGRATVSWLMAAPWYRYGYMAYMVGR